VSTLLSFYRNIGTVIKVWENSKKWKKHLHAALDHTAFLVLLNFYSYFQNSVSRNRKNVFYFLYNTMHVLRMKQSRMLLDTWPNLSFCFGSKPEYNSNCTTSLWPANRNAWFPSYYLVESNLFGKALVNCQLLSVITINILRSFLTFASRILTAHNLWRH